MADPTYVALKPLKVHCLEADGTPKYDDETGRPVMRKCAPGDPIPEAVYWPTLWREVRAGRVGMEGSPLPGPGLTRADRNRVERSVKPRAKKASRRRRGRQASTGEMTADEVAVAQATGEVPPEQPASEPEPVPVTESEPAPEGESEDVAPVAVDAEGDDPEEG